MKKLLLLPLLLLSGCALSPTGFINKHIPDGTISSLHLAVGIMGGSGGTIDGKGIVKTQTSITAEEFHMTMHDVANPFFQLDIVAPPQQPVTLNLK